MLRRIVARLGWQGAAAGLAAALLLPLPALGADPAKVLRYAFPAPETGFDPARVNDLYSNTINEAIFDRLLTYDYLARPAKLVPMAAEAMPEVAENGKVYTFRIRKGIYFTPDPAFKGAKRELVAQDFVYSFMRFVDPKIRSPYGFLVEGKIEGLDDLAEQAKRTGKFNYDAKVRGLEAVDRYTLRFRLTTNDYNFPYITSQLPSYAVAREVIEAYGDESIAHPVGTGPYMLKSWSRRAKIVLEANPDYRGFVWDFQPSADAWDQALIAAMRGKKMPQIGRVEITIIEEDQSRWLAFNQKELDLLNLPAVFRPQVFDAEKSLKPEWEEKGVAVYRAIDPDITYSYFNFKDPLTGGFSREKLALRRAMIMAYNLDEEIRVIRKNQAVPVEMPIPAGVVGHDPSYRSINRYNPELANRLLDYFNYKRGKDGIGRSPTASRSRSSTRRGRLPSTASSTSCGRSRWIRSASGWTSR
jgi:ABC-type transport system substrate-binding protein